jgi:hypothetical protein
MMSHAHEQAAPRTRGLLVSDLLAGTPERLPLSVALGLTVQVAQLIERTHQSGRLHLAIGPAAVWCTTEGEVWLEWLPRKWPQHRSLPPELRRGETPVIESDVYALGALAYELLTGLSVSRAWAKAPLVDLSHVASPKYFNPEVPEAVDALIIQMLARDPYDRPHSAAEVADAVAAFVAEGEWEGTLASLLVDPFYEPALRALPITCERARAPEPMPALADQPPPPTEKRLQVAPEPPPVAQTTEDEEEDEEPGRPSTSLVKVMLLTGVAAVASVMLCLSAHVLWGDEGGLARDAAQSVDVAPPQRVPPPALVLGSPPPPAVMAPAPEAGVEAPRTKSPVKPEHAHTTARKLSHGKRRGR